MEGVAMALVEVEEEKQEGAVWVEVVSRRLVVGAS